MDSPLKHHFDPAERPDCLDVSPERLNPMTAAQLERELEAALEAERSIVDVKTLQHTNEQLISTLDEVMKIQTEGSQKRREAEAELGRIEGELKQKLLELRG